jgi:hypothetical protein
MGKYAPKKAKSSWYQASVDSIEAAEDDGFEHWQSRTWKFTRLMKSQYPTLSAETVMDLVPWAETEFDEEDQIQFMREFNLVRFIPGMDPLDWAWQMAQEHPLGAPPKSPYRRFGFYGKVLGIAGWLQVLVGVKKAIYLPGRRVGKMLGISNRTVSTMCTYAVKDGLMEVIEKHKMHRATRYRFKIEINGQLKRWVATSQNDSEDSEDLD